MINFWQTGEGKRFYCGTMPAIEKALANIAKEMKRANDLNEEELHPKKYEVIGQTGVDEPEGEGR